MDHVHIEFTHRTYIYAYILCGLYEVLNHDV